MSKFLSLQRQKFIIDFPNFTWSVTMSMQVCEIFLTDLKNNHAIASVQLSTHIFAQGQIVKLLSDGRITIDCNGSHYTGCWIKRQGQVIKLDSTTTAFSARLEVTG